MIIIIVVLMTGCESKPPGPPVVVYATAEPGSDLEKLFADFTAETDIPVSVFWGDSADNTDNLINNTDSSVGVLITTNVADIWRAAEEGALRPIEPTALGNVSPILKDADGFWAAIEMREHVIAMATGKVRPVIASYDELADPVLRGRVCLTSSALHINRSLIAMLVHDRGVRKTERLVRQWMQNLAAAPFSSQQELIDAMREGVCDYGILEGLPDEGDLVIVMPQPVTMDIDGIGVARHAPQAELAQRLVEWLLNKRSIRPVGDLDILPAGIAGWRDEDALLLVERAGYR